MLTRPHEPGFGLKHTRLLQSCKSQKIIYGSAEEEGGMRSIICPSPPWILNDSLVSVKEAFHRPCYGKVWALGCFELHLHSLGVILHIRKQLLFWRECSCVFLRLSWACSVCISWWCAAENAVTGNRNSLLFMSFLHRPPHWRTRLHFCG